MACYEIFGFLIILKESTKLLHKNGKLFASIAFLSLLLQSIFVVLFDFSLQSLMDNMMTSSPTIDSQNEFKYIALAFALQIVFVLAVITIFHLSGVATTLISSASYSNHSLSPQDLMSSIKRTWRKPLSMGFHSSRKTTRYTLLVMVLVALLVVMNPNAITISIAIFLGIMAYVFCLYEGVVSILVFVALVVEDALDRNEALEKAEEIVKGQRLHGLLLNLFFNLVLAIFLCYWMIQGDIGQLHLMGYGLFVINVASLLRIFVLMAYTVFYYQCKKHHGEEIAVLGKSMYSKLPISDV